MRPSASWPTAVRGARGPSWLVVNSSPARKTGGPVADDLRAAADRRDDAGPVRLEEEPRRHELARPAPPPSSAAAADAGGDEHGAAERDRHGRAAVAHLDDRSGEVGVRDRGREREEDRGGRAGHRRRGRPPRLRVERDPVAPEGGLLNVFSVRLAPAPCQVPTNETRRTSSVPSVVTPALARSFDGGLAT